MATWWLSFCDPEKPKGQQFSGVALVEADSLPGAITVAWTTGCNPGGQIRSAELPPPDMIPEDRRAALAAAPRHTLLSRDDLEALGLMD